jgi:hypothetical protein
MNWNDPNWVSAIGGWVGAIGTWFASILVLATLWYIRKQLIGLQRTIETATIQSIWTMWLEVDKFFVEHPELKPYFYHALDVDENITGDMLHRLESTAELLLDTFAHNYDQKHSFATKGFEWYGNFMKSRYRTQPFLRRFVDEHVDWYNPAFIDYLQEPE